MIEYPKSLYLEGVFGAHVIVHDQEQEKYWRETYGFTALTDEPAPAKRKYVRKAA